MKNKKIILFTGISVLCAALVFGVVSTRANKTLFLPSEATENTYTVKLDKDNKPSALPAEYNVNSPVVFDNVKATSGYDLNLTFLNAKSSTGNLAQLAPRGMIYNFANGNKEFKGLKSVKFTGTGTVYFASAKYGYPGGSNGCGSILNDYIVLPSGTAKDVPVSSYFQLIAGDGGATIESLELTYTCVDTGFNIANVAGSFTGIGQDSYTYQLDISKDGSAVLKSLNKVSNTTLNGTATMSSATRVSIAFSENLTLNLDTDDYKLSLTHVSKSGSDAGTITVINTFYRVYNVEDFEAYSGTGAGLDQQHTTLQTSNLRSAFYSDYYSGSSSQSSPIGGQKWYLMGGDYDYITYTANKGHNGSKAAAFKGNSNKLRYISMNSLYGVPKIIGAGAYLSFWAKGAYTSTALDTPSPADAKVKLYAFYNSQVNSSNQGTRTELQFTITANSDWTEYRMPLDQTKFYYGFGFYCENSTKTYTVIDDIKIYSVTPYAVPPVNVTGVSVSPENVEIKTGATSQLTATVSPNDATNKNVTWSSSNENVATVSSTGLVTGVAIGNATITARTVDGNFTDTCSVTVANLNYPEGTFITHINYGSGIDITYAIGNEDNELVKVLVSNQDAHATSISYNKSTKAVTIVTDGTVNLGDQIGDKTVGTITGTFNPVNQTITNITCNGSLSGLLGGNQLSAERPTYYYDCDGTTSQLQSTFKRRYGTGGAWSVDTGNADRFTSNTSNYVAGEGAMNVRPWASAGNNQAYTVNLNSDLPGNTSTKNIAFWVNNPSEHDILIRMWVYTSASLGGAAETGSVLAKAGGWTYCSMGYGSKKLYNFQISVWNSDSGTYEGGESPVTIYNKTNGAIGVQLTFDNIAVF